MTGALRHPRNASMVILIRGNLFLWKRNGGPWIWFYAFYDRHECAFYDYRAPRHILGVIGLFTSSAFVSSALF